MFYILLFQSNKNLTNIFLKIYKIKLELKIHLLSINIKVTIKILFWPNIKIEISISIFKIDIIFNLVDYTFKSCNKLIIVY